MTKIDIKIGDGIQTKSRRLTLWDLNIGDFYTTDEEPDNLRKVWNKTETAMVTVTATATATAIKTAMEMAMATVTEMAMAMETAMEMEYKWINKLEAQKISVTRYNRIVIEAIEPQDTI